jgi:hypothetical protein
MPLKKAKYAIKMLVYGFNMPLKFKKKLALEQLISINF